MGAAPYKGGMMKAIASMLRAYNIDLIVIGSSNRFVVTDGVLCFENIVTTEVDQCLLGGPNEYEKAQIFILDHLIDEYRRYVNLTRKF